MSEPFYRGVWYQPASSHAKWASRGCNFLLGYENEGGGTSYATWKAAAVAAGLKYVVQWKDPTTHNTTPGPLTGADDADPNLLAVLLPDEPDGVGGLTPGQILDMANAARAMLPSKPLFLNFDGDKFRWRPFNDYRCYCYAADWLGMDWYPINGGYAGNAIQTADAIVQMGQKIDKLRDFIQAAGGNKKMFGALECADQNLKVGTWLHIPQNQPLGEQMAAKMRGPTSAEMAAEVAEYLKRPMGGIYYFPDCIGFGWCGFDAMNADQVSGMQAINTMLANR